MINHYSREAEVSLIGSVLCEVATIDEIDEIAMPDEFFYEDSRIVWSHILELIASAKQVDRLTLKESLIKSNQFDGIGDEFIVECVASVPNSRHAKKYNQMVRDLAAKRRLIIACEDIIKKASSGEGETENLLAAAQKTIIDASTNNATAFVDMRDNVSSMLDEICNRERWKLPGISTGFYDLDDKIGGLQSKHVYIIAARPAIGKTSIVLNMAEHMAINSNSPVGIFSLEMGIDEIQLPNIQPTSL